jgi:hypothetical protein
MPHLTLSRTISLSFELTTLTGVRLGSQVGAAERLLTRKRLKIRKIVKDLIEALTIITPD